MVQGGDFVNVKYINKKKNKLKNKKNKNIEFNF
jgi:hypothetical protein